MSDISKRDVRHRDDDWTPEWKTWRDPYGIHRAKLELVGPDEVTLPPIRLDYCLHFFGVSMGYTCAAWTRRRLEKKMAREEQKAMAL